MPVNEYKEAKCIFKFFKIYTDLEKEKIKLYESETNEAMYLLCFLRPIFRVLTRSQPWTKFLWSECTLKCKKDEENELLLESDGKATSATKVDGIIVDEVYDVEVALIEVSGPNWKVDTSHFFEDRKKLAKNLKCVYKSIISLKTGVSLVSRKNLKVYGFHFYLNKLHIYSLSRPTSGPFVFQIEHSMKIPVSKYITHCLSGLISELWIIRGLLQEQHEQIKFFLADDEPSPEISPCCSEDDVYISPRKKMKTKCNND
ncbi:hypothetical protein BDF21DRAFT_190711 [Thamnidium elegans]|nr:hypothetical protein BDF21DRAFT_190711 [Thamnidium elegans]